jgi:membrane protein DedA with SNARE-associated domain
MEDAISFFVGQGSYGLMLAALIVAGLGFPLPEDIVMISGGILAQQGKTDLALTVGVLALGVFIGDSTLYFLGRWAGQRVYEWRFIQRVMPKARREWLEEQIHQRGAFVVFVARHVAGFRGAVFAICAIHGISYPRFILADMTSLIISLPLWMGIGWFVGTSMDQLEKTTKSAEMAVTIGVVVLVILVLIGHAIGRTLRRRASERMEPPAPPAA